jgi:N-acetylneuraminate synthase/N,N'-diacetyllegionaminate synthase
VGGEHHWRGHDSFDRVVRVLAGSRPIGADAPCFIVAEVGVNHDGEVARAHELIDAAADAGADAVKFQNFKTADFIVDRSLPYEYESEGQTVVESQFDMLVRYELPDSAWAELRDHCERRGVVFFSTPTSEAGLARLVELGVPLLKNGSDYLGHLPLIRAMARTGLPTVLSTGMATLEEIRASVDAFREAGGRELVLLHCTSSYPTPAEDVNLRKIPSLEAQFDCPVGFSDHTDGVVAAVGSVALGSCFIEKHFTLDRSLPGPDHRFSMDPPQLRELVDAVRTLEANLGSPEIKPAESELLGRDEFRLSCVAAVDVHAGQLLTAAEVQFSRPGTGVAPRDVDSLLGRRAVRDLAAGEVLTLDAVE